MINSISIVIPILNEKKNITKLCEELKKKLTNIKYEVIFVDDKSTDGSLNVLKKMKSKDKRFNYLIHKGKKDLTQSCFQGIRKSKNSLIVIMDGDLQHQPKDIKKLLKIFQLKKAHIVIGSRELFTSKKHNLSFMRLSASRILIFIVNLLLGNKTSDPMSGFFIFKKNIFIKNKNKLFNKGYKILMDLIYLDEKYQKIYDVKINFANRKKGESKMNMKILLSLIYMILYKLYAKIL